MPKTIEEIETIEKKIENNEKLKPYERCEGFSIINGKVTDRNIHDIDDPWDEEIEKLMKTGKTYLEAARIILASSYSSK